MDIVVDQTEPQYRVSKIISQDYMLSADTESDRNSLESWLINLYATKDEQLTPLYYAKVMQEFHQYVVDNIDGLMDRALVGYNLKHIDSEEFDEWEECHIKELSSKDSSCLDFAVILLSRYGQDVQIKRISEILSDFYSSPEYDTENAFYIYSRFVDVVRAEKDGYDARFLDKFNQRQTLDGRSKLSSGSERHRFSDDRYSLDSLLEDL